MKPRRILFRTASVAGIAVLLSGCMKLDVDLNVHENDTVDGTMIMGLDRSLAEFSGDSDSLVEDLVGDETVPEGATAERYEDEDYIGAQYTLDAVALEEFDLEEGDNESLSITREGDEFIASGVLDLSDAGTDGELDEQADALAQRFIDSFEVRIAITFPGEIIETNGEVDGTTVVWVPEPGERLEISARAADSGGIGGLPVWAWIVIGVVVVAAIAALAYFLMRSREQSADDSDAGPSGYPPPPAAASQPYPQAPAPTNETTEMPTTEAPTQEPSHDNDRDGGTPQPPR